ncbi:hypothetical protein M513_02404 [Trichuris suis]|uniref:ISXO2-like transposase domain-containing protein n=1 Tax=Trichuris suis TaxID=68888 RepID=A0A085MHN1_9BILA|nr:hypothetical protein M513_02404 [Trichuris suis]
MNVRWLYSTVKDEECAATLLREKGLLHQERLCPSCCSDLMQLGRGGKVWRCHKRSCREEVSIRTGTWFEGRRGRLKLQNAVGLMFFWSRGYSSMKVCSDELGINKSVTCRWNRCIREVAAEALAELPVQLGGPSQTVELDETLFCRSKYGRGREYTRRQWVFGGTCRETGQSFVAPVENQSSRTLMPIVKRHVRPGTTVITDEWRGYRFLAREGDTHMRVNYSHSFVNRATGAHTQSIESLWSHAKRGNKIRCGTHQTSLPLHLCEFMWRKRLASGDDPFEKLLQDIAKLYPPH